MISFRTYKIKYAKVISPNFGGCRFKTCGAGSNCHYFC